MIEHKSLARVVRLSPFMKARRHKSAVRRSSLIAVLSVIGVTAGLLTPLSAQATTTTEVEPNYTSATAQSVALGTTVNGGWGTVADYGGSDRDYYSFTAAQAGRFTLDLQFASGLGSSGSLYVTVFNSANTDLYSLTLAPGDYSGSRLRNFAMFVDSGTYYVRLEASVSASSAWRGQSYTLQATVTPGVVETETNGTSATADAIALGVPISAGFNNDECANYDCDYFKFTTTQAGRLVLDLQFANTLGTTGSLYVTVFDGSNHDLYDLTLAPSDYSGSRMRSFTMYVDAGSTYYVKLEALITSSSVWRGQAYTLQATVTPGVVETELNGTTSTANSIGLGVPISAGINNDECANYDCDYFKFTTAQAGRLVLDLQFASTLGTSGSMYVTVYAESSSPLYSFTLSPSDYLGKRLRNFAMYVDAGTTYVKVEALVTSSSVWRGQPYTLTATVTPGVVESEPNADKASANVIDVGVPIAGAANKVDCGSYDCDYYRIPLEAPTKLALDFQFACNLGTSTIYYVRTYDNSGTQLWSADLTGSACLGSTVRSKSYTVPAGNFYVQVYGRVSSSYASYGQPYTLKAYAMLTATPTPKISGTAKVGSTMTATAGTWSPAPVTLDYQWLRSGVAISGATSNSYTLTGSDYAKKISVKVTGSKSGFGTVSKTSSSSATVAAGTLTPTVKPTITGERRVGSTLTAETGTWGPAPVTFSYQWYRSGKAITGAKSATYLLKSTDLAKKISVKVTGKKTGYSSVAKLSSSTSSIARGILTTSTASITGSPIVGTTLSASFTTWGPGTVTMHYQWYRAGKAITGATKSTYKITSSDVGKLITVRLTGSKSGFTTVSTTSTSVTPTAS
jgi:hypothetical protein